MALNPFHYHGKSATGPALESFPITPNDSADLSTHIRAITLNEGGTLSWLSVHGTVQTTAALPPGTIYPKNVDYTGLKLLDVDPLTKPGALILPAEAPVGTKVGLRTGTATVAAAATNPWLDNFSAKALES